MDTIENLVFRDKINKLLKNTYKKIDLDEIEKYESWDNEDFDYINDTQEEMRIW